MNKRIEEKEMEQEKGRKRGRDPEAQQPVDNLTPAEVVSIEHVSLSGEGEKVMH